MASLGNYTHMYIPTQIYTMVAILGCQVDYNWNELQSRNEGYTIERFSVCFEVVESTSSPDS